MQRAVVPGRKPGAYRTAPAYGNKAHTAGVKVRVGDVWPAKGCGAWAGTRCVSTAAACGDKAQQLGLG